MEAIEGFINTLFFAGAFFLIKFAWDQVRKKHVFIIEDSPFDESIIRTSLHLKHAKIHFCRSFNDYLVKRLLQKPDAVIIDYRLPDLRGDRIFKLCKSQAIPAVMITADKAPIFGIDDTYVIRKTMGYTEAIRLFLKRYQIA